MALRQLPIDNNGAEGVDLLDRIFGFPRQARGNARTQLNELRFRLNFLEIGLQNVQYVESAVGNLFEVFVSFALFAFPLLLSMVIDYLSQLFPHFDRSQYICQSLTTVLMTLACLLGGPYFMYSLWHMGEASRRPRRAALLALAGRMAVDQNSAEGGDNVESLGCLE